MLSFTILGKKLWKQLLYLDRLLFVFSCIGYLLLLLIIIIVKFIRMIYVAASVLIYNKELYRRVE